MIDRPIRDVVCILISFVIAITIHECMHAFTAHRLGDDTAKRLGRITLNPLEHFDPIGALGMLLIALGFPFIGWGKPVPVQPGNFRGRWARHRNQGSMLVSAAGPLSNVAQAVVGSLVVRYSLETNTDLGNIGEFFRMFVYINLLLAAFNMIPIPPLDGYRILTGMLSSFWRPILAPLEQYGFMLLFILFFIGGRLGSSLVSGMIDPVYDLLQQVVYWRLT